MLVMLEIMDVLNANPNIILDDTADASEERTAEPQPNEKGEVRVWGNLVAFVERLDDEMFKSLQVSSNWATRCVGIVPATCSCFAAKAVQLVHASGTPSVMATCSRAVIVVT